MSGDGSQYVSQQILGAGLVIAIDGPSGAGKSTIARLSAAELGTRFFGYWCDVSRFDLVCTTAGNRP